MTGREATLEKRCVKRARQEGGELLKLLPWLASGLPDRLLLLPKGVIAFVEFKAPDGRLTPLQVWWKDRLEKLGFVHEVIRSVDEFDDLLIQLTDPPSDDPRENGWVGDNGLP